MRFKEVLTRFNPKNAVLNPRNCDDLAEIYRRMLTGEYKFVGKIGKLCIPPDVLKAQILVALEKDARNKCRKALKKGDKVTVDGFLESTRESSKLLHIYDEIGLEMSVVESVVKDAIDNWEKGGKA